MMIDTAGRCDICGTVVRPNEMHMCAGAPSLSNLPMRVFGNVLPPEPPARREGGHTMTDWSERWWLEVQRDVMAA